MLSSIGSKLRGSLRLSTSHYPRISKVSMSLLAKSSVAPKHWLPQKPMWNVTAKSFGSAFRSYVSSSPPSVKNINKSQLEQIMKGDPDSYLLIDVREPAELKFGQLPNSQNIPRT